MHELGLKYGADKASDTHEYTKVYPTYFEKFRDKPLSLIELGTFKGASCNMWEEYFTHPDAKLVGYDHLEERVTKYLPKGPRWTGVQGDQWDVEKLCDIATYGPWDIVIDDCVHGALPQQYTFEAFWPHIKSGGVHVIEDINFSSYNPRWYVSRVQEGPMTILPYLNTLLDELLIADSKGKGFSGKYFTDIAFIHFYKHVAIIGKK